MMNDRTTDAGFSYVDVMIAVTVLMVGVMAMLSAITYGVVMTTTSSQQLAAKQYAQSTVEAIFSARDLDRLGFESIGNAGDPRIPGGVFLVSRQKFYPAAGRDGIIGTADDSAGADLIVGTEDDIQAVDGFMREIVITDVPDPSRPTLPISLRQVEVTISYKVGNVDFREKMTTYAANYRTTDE